MELCGALLRANYAGPAQLTFYADYEECLDKVQTIMACRATPKEEGSYAREIVESW